MADPIGSSARKRRGESAGPAAPLPQAMVMGGADPGGLENDLSSDLGFRRACCLAVVLAVVCSIAEHVQAVPYGKFGSAGRISVSIDSRFGWWLMELPCSALFVYLFFVTGGRQARDPVPRFFAFVFCCHYLYRGWLFPALIRQPSNNFDLFIAMGSWPVTLTHAFLSARWYARHGTHLAGADAKWFKDKRFQIGIALYYTGLGLVVWHDHIMRALRPCPGGARYCIPRGGLYEYATMAGYTSELVAWLGFAIASWGPNGAFILAVSVGNLVPRAAASHQWYLNEFGGEYAALGRARLVPGLW